MIERPPRLDRRLGLLHSRRMTPDALDRCCDPLGETLHQLRMSGVFYCQSDPRAPWGAHLPAMQGCLLLHLVPRDRCWLRAGDGDGEATQMHRDPARSWRLATLASACNMSRSALAQRFTALTGLRAHEYLTGWRMRLAQHWLAQGLDMAEVAARTGYRSDAAFARAFKRVQGSTPGRLRRASPETGAASALT